MDIYLLWASSLCKCSETPLNDKSKGHIPLENPNPTQRIPLLLLWRSYFFLGPLSRLRQQGDRQNFQGPPSFV